MSLHGDYVREREGLDIYEDGNGFATFSINGEECYIVDIYVRPEARRGGHGSRMADRIAQHAKKHGCAYLKGSIDPSTNGATESMKGLLAYGFKLWKIKEPLIFLVKRI